MIPADPARAQDQSFRIDRFAPAPSPEDGLAVPHPSTVGHLRPFVGLIFDYAYAPLRARRGGGDAVPLVEHRLLAHLNGGLGITDRIEVHLRVPLALTLAGGQVSGLPVAETFSMSDAAIGGSVRILGEGDRQGFWLGATAELLVPLGVENGFASDLEVGARGVMTLAYGIPSMTTLVVLGAAYRPERAFENARSGSELEFAVAFSFAMASWLDVWVELLGASIFRLTDDGSEPYFFSPRGTPLELLAGARVTTVLGIAVEAGIGFGLTSAPGVPMVRAMLGVRWATGPEAPGDTDGDGFLDPGDACPEEPEDVDRWEDGDGCPEADNDADHVLDEDDGCPREAEDEDGIRDADGCPDPDDDEDGTEDDRDSCPRSPGPDWTRGCPQTIRVPREGDEIELLRPITFEGASTLAAASETPLEELRATLAVDPRMRIRIEVRARGEAGGRGRRGAGADLGPARAEAIAAWLAAHEIEAARVEAVGLPPDGGEPTIVIRVLDRTPLPPEDER